MVISTYQSTQTQLISGCLEIIYKLFLESLENMPAREETETESQQEPLIPQEQSVTKPNKPQISLFRGQIILNPGISRINFLCFLLHSMVSSGIMMPTSQLALPLLTNYYGLNNDERLNVSAINQL